MMRFWYEGFLALRYLRAAPRRGFVSLIAGIAMIGLALGVAVLVVVLSVMNGFEEELRTRILSLTAHATITGLDGRLKDWPREVAALAHFPGIVAAAPYIEDQGMVTHGGKSAGILLRGVLPAAERRVADPTPHLLAGALDDLVPGKFRVILGKDLAETLGAKPGDRRTGVKDRPVMPARPANRLTFAPGSRSHAPPCALRPGRWRGAAARRRRR